MRVFDLKKNSGRRITEFGSNFLMAPLTRSNAPMQVSFFHLEAGGVVGYHQAKVAQLLLVTDGEGTVRGKEDEQVNVKTGQVVLWEKDEWHETVSEQGLTAIVMESSDFDLLLEGLQ
ncbi:cupin domain-containing protein [Lentibacillus sediminis]|uniref:cupin domain-containing protein n=1 Tax=Lentibacillus sediminis TaxID=1940529 RepID=UPI000C1C7B9B|nr:cupin domain-containing protein [Lentibacillus sediminis]